MAIRNFAKYCAAALVLAACTVKESADMQAPNLSEPALSSATTVNILFSEDFFTRTKAADREVMLEDLGVTHLERVFPDAGEYEARSRKMGLHLYYTARLGEGTSATKAAASLSDLPGVVRVTPSRTISKRSFNDPYLSRQWHLTGSDYPGTDIHVQEVWEKYTTGSPKVIVCVVDEAVDASHEDLQGNIWRDESMHSGYNYVTKRYDVSIRPGDDGHGTHVAGTIAAVSNNGIGVTGIAGGDAGAGVGGVRILSHVLFSGSSSCSDAMAARAIKEGADRGAVISQNSWGFSMDQDEDGIVSEEEEQKYHSWDYSEDVYEAAIRYFCENAGCDAYGKQRADSPMKGGLVFFAAGNDDKSYEYICSNDPLVISVGAYDIQGNRASYSNYGDWVDIAAPGGGAKTEADVIWSALPFSLWQEGYAGWDALGPWRGTSMACPHASGVAALIVSYFGGSGFTADAAREILFAGLGPVIGGSKPIGGKLDALASFEYGVKHYPAGGYTGEDEPPVVELEESEIEVKAHERVELDFIAYDPNGESVTLSLDPGSNALSLDKAKSRLVISGWKDEPGTYTAVLKASAGAYVSEASLRYTLLPNHAPKPVTSIDKVSMDLLRVWSLPVEGLFEDEDGETLSVFAERSGDPCVTVLIEDGKVKMAPVSVGAASVTLSATDFMGEEAVIRFPVAVIDPNHPVTLASDVVSTEAVFYINSIDTAAVKLSLYGAAGGLALQTETEASAFEPIHLDVSALAPGRYTAVLEYNNTSYKIRVIKY